MRIFVVEPRGDGGMIHYAYQMCTALADAGADVTLVTSTDYELAGFPHNFHVEPRMRLWALYDPANKPTGGIGRLAYKLFRNVRRVVRALRYIRTWDRTTRYIIRQNPDVVQFGKIEFDFESVFLERMRIAGLTLGQICHEFEDRESGGFISRLPGLRGGGDLYGNFEAIFFHAEDNRARFLTIFEYPPDHTYIIPHGNEGMFVQHASDNTVDMRAKYGLPPDVPVVVFFGNLMPSKGIPDLIEAFATVRDQSDAHLVIAGYPSKFINMAELKEQVARHTLEDRIVWDSRYIPIEEVGPLMRMARVVVYPYRTSTQSGSLQVAYACGRPVIATEVGGLPDVVEQGKSGLLVPPEDPPALAQAILDIVTDAERAKQMGDYAKHLSETKYSWRPIAERVLEAYEEVT